MTSLSVVLGASGGIGSALVSELLARGARVRAVGRRSGPVPTGAETLTADVATPEGAATAVRGADVVYHCA
ncbi:MAG: NAD(P)H-binding protein, partial [Phycicoccus sp.]